MTTVITPEFWNCDLNIGDVYDIVEYCNKSGKRITQDSYRDPYFSTGGENEDEELIGISIDEFMGNLTREWAEIAGLARQEKDKATEELEETTKAVSELKPDSIDPSAKTQGEIN